jgi:inhibitor of cysteine peptidase
MAWLNRSIQFFLWIALALLMTDCALSSPQGGQTVNSITVTEKDNGGRITLTPGDILVVRLQCSPGTGYSWVVAQNDENLMARQGEPVYENPAKTPLLGGMEYVLFHFKALRSGTNTLRLAYQRPWEKDTAPIRTFVLTAIIR